MNCSSPWGHFSYGATCTFHCPEGQSLNGSAAAACGPDGQWSAAMPTCQGTSSYSFRSHADVENNQIWVPLGMSGSGLAFRHGVFPSLGKRFTMNQAEPSCLHGAEGSGAALCVGSRPSFCSTQIYETNPLIAL